MIFGGTVMEKIFHTKYGDGHVYWGKEIRTVLAEHGIEPDFDFYGNVENTALDFIHRKVDDIDIYFVRNTTAEEIEGTAIFRQRKKEAEFWDPASGKMFAVRKIKG